MANMGEGMITINDIKPIAIYLPDTEYWRERHRKGAEHFAKIGIENILWIRGIYAEGFGLYSTYKYKLDGTDEDIKQSTVGANLTGNLIYTVCTAIENYNHFMLLEDDARFPDNWKEQLEEVLKIVPDDFDFINLGACCMEGKEKKLVAGNVYETKNAMCGHATIFSKRGAQMILENCRSFDMPFDIAFLFKVYPQCKVYAVLPKLADQEGMNLPL